MMKKSLFLILSLLSVPAWAEAPLAGDLLSADAKTLSARCDGAIAATREKIARLKALPRASTAPAVLAALDLYDEAMAGLDNAAGVGDIAFNASPDAATRAAGEACEQKIAAVTTEIELDHDVYQALAQLDPAALDGPTRYYLKLTLDEFRRNGVDRDAVTRARAFSKNVNEDTRHIEVDPRQLDGMPADWIAAHKPQANGKVIVTTQYPDYIPFMSFARSEKAREQLLRQFYLRATPQNHDMLDQLLQKRHALATLLGSPNFAAWSLENKMIESPQKAHDFIDQISRLSDQRAHDDYQILLARLQQDVPTAKVVQQWDTGYLRQRVSVEQLGFDPQAVRPYFEFRRVQKGLMDITARMFGIQFRRVSNARVWHPDVEVYDVRDGGRSLGRIYLDLHPRAGKFSHAAQFGLTTGKAGVRLPEGVLLCNFPKPGEQPALMTHDEVKTFFHEFGHLLQHTFSGHTRWAGTAQYHEWDFVEAPSQLLEEWVDDAPTLRTFARHYQTNAPIPTALVAKMKAAQSFGRGLDVRRQMVYASVSLAYHDRDPKGLDTDRVLAEMEQRFTPQPHVEHTEMQSSFGHLVGYGAGYYTYMWSLVIARDLLTPFRAAGLLDRGVAGRYRRMVLEPAGEKPAAQLVRDFLGRPFNIEAYGRWINEGVGSGS
jgi:thimet oligopeptidase